MRGMTKRRRFDLEAFFLIGLALVVVLGRQWWRLSHRLGVPMLSAEAIRSFAPILAFAAVVICLVVVYWLVTDKTNRPKG
jgi:hypothetical protein